MSQFKNKKSNSDPELASFFFPPPSFPQTDRPSKHSRQKAFYHSLAQQKFHEAGRAKQIWAAHVEVRGYRGWNRSRGDSVDKHQLLHLFFITTAGPYFCSLHLPLLNSTQILVTAGVLFNRHSLLFRTRPQKLAGRRLGKPVSAQWKAWQANDLSKCRTGRQQTRREEQSDGVGGRNGGAEYAEGEKDFWAGGVKKNISECIKGDQSEESDPRPRSNYISWGSSRDITFLLTPSEGQRHHQPCSCSSNHWPRALWPPRPTLTSHFQAKYLWSSYC